jgi:anti-anti-sigma regulatory factor
MEIYKNNQGIIEFKGNLVVSAIEDVFSAMETILDNSSQDIVIDLGQAEDIDIAGLQLLYSLKKTLEAEGSLHIRSVSDPVMERIVLSGFDMALKEALP